MTPTPNTNQTQQTPAKPYLYDEFLHTIQVMNSWHILNKEGAYEIYQIYLTVPDESKDYFIQQLMEEARKKMLDNEFIEDFTEYYIDSKEISNAIIDQTEDQIRQIEKQENKLQSEMRELQAKSNEAQGNQTANEFKSRVASREVMTLDQLIDTMPANINQNSGPTTFSHSSSSVSNISNLANSYKNNSDNTQESDNNQLSQRKNLATFAKMKTNTAAEPTASTTEDQAQPVRVPPTNINYRQTTQPTVSTNQTNFVFPDLVASPNNPVPPTNNQVQQPAQPGNGATSTVDLKTILMESEHKSHTPSFGNKPNLNKFVRPNQS
ncbi:MAG: hypothetical protein OHK0017_13440 [Patescibacteria group bacterium]